MSETTLAPHVRSVLDLQLLQIGGRPITPGTLLVFALVLGGAWLLSVAVRRALRGVLERRGLGDEGSGRMVSRLVHYGLMLGGVVAALQTIGIDLSTLFAAGAVFTVGLGFAMQNIAQNFVSGVILMFERSIKPGDVLEVDGQVVRVKRIGIRATIARTRNEEEIIIPNSTLIQGTVKSYTLSDSLCLIGAQVGVAYGSDMALVRRTLEESARRLDWQASGTEPRVLLAGFGSSSVDWGVYVWTTDPWRGRRLLSSLNEAIWWGLKEAGVTIAFPQVDVHFDPPVAGALQAAARGG
jgi:small-conductance mechanosensitive channel